MVRKYKVVEITGKAGAGKTTLASHLTTKLVNLGFSVYRTSFASSLKKILYNYFKVLKEPGLIKEKYNGTHIDFFLAKFDEDFPFVLTTEKRAFLKDILTEFHRTKAPDLVRKIMQYVGTEVFREYKDDFWVNTLVNNINDIINDVDFVIIDDYRFLNEDLSNYFPKQVLRIRIEVPNEIRKQRLGYLPDENHVSEKYIDKLPVDLVINSSDELEEIVKKLLETKS